MAFQIDERQLSKTARDKLSNAKSKAQYARDALEYYARKEGDFEELSAIRKELAEIKATLASNGAVDITSRGDEPSDNSKPKEVVADKSASETVPDCYL